MSYLAVIAPYHFMPGNSMRLLVIILIGIAAHKRVSIVQEDLGQERLFILLRYCVQNSPEDYVGND